MKKLLLFGFLVVLVSCEDEASTAPRAYVVEGEDAEDSLVQVPDSMVELLLEFQRVQDSIAAAAEYASTHIDLRDQASNGLLYSFEARDQGLVSVAGITGPNSDWSLLYSSCQTLEALEFIDPLQIGSDIPRDIDWGVLAGCPNFNRITLRWWDHGLVGEVFAHFPDQFDCIAVTTGWGPFTVDEVLAAAKPGAVVRLYMADHQYGHYLNADQQALVASKGLDISWDGLYEGCK